MMTIDALKYLLSKTSYLFGINFFPSNVTMTDKFYAHRLHKKRQKSIVPPIQFTSLVPIDNYNGNGQACLHLFGGLTTDEQSAKFSNSTFVYIPKQNIDESTMGKDTSKDESTRDISYIKEKRAGIISSLGTGNSRKSVTRNLNGNSKTVSNSTTGTTKSTDLKYGWKRLPTNHSIEKRAFHSIVVRNVHGSSRSGKTSQSLLLFGGSNETTLLSDVWIFESNIWKGPISTKNTPDGTMSHSMVYSEDLDAVFVFGGETRSKKSSQILMLHCKDSWKWETITPSNTKTSDIITARSAHCAQLWKNEEMLVFGGDTEDDRQTNETWIFSLSKQEWRKVEPKGDVPSPRSCAASAIWGDSMFVFGGFPYSNDCYEFDFIEERWRKIVIEASILPSPRSGAGLAILTEKNRGKEEPVMYIFGGRCYEKGDISDTNDLFRVTFPELYRLNEDNDLFFKELEYNQAKHLTTVDMSKKVALQLEKVDNFVDSSKFNNHEEHQTKKQLENADGSSKQFSGMSKLLQQNLPQKGSGSKSNAQEPTIESTKNTSLSRYNSLQDHNEMTSIGSVIHSKTLEILRESEIESIQAKYELKLNDALSMYQAKLADKDAENIRLRQNFDSSQKTIANLMEELALKKKEYQEEVEISKKQLDIETTASTESLKQLKKELKESEKMQESLFGECRRLQESNSSLVEEVRKKDLVILELKNELENYLQSNNQHIPLQESAQQEMLEENDKTLQQIKYEYEADVLRIKKELDEQKDVLQEYDIQKNELETKNHELEKQIRVYQQQIEDINKLYELEYNTSHEVVTEKQLEVRSLIRTLNDTEKAISSILYEDVSSEVSELSANLPSSLKDIIQKIKSKFQDLLLISAQYEKISMEHENLQKKLEAEMNDVGSRYEGEISELKVNHSKLIERLKEEHEKELQSLVAMHSESVTQLTFSHKQALSNLNSVSLESLHTSRKENEQLQESVKTLQEKLNHVEKKNEEALLSIINSSEEIHMLKSELTKCSEVESQLKSTISEKNNIINELSGQVNNLEKRLEESLESHSNEVKRISEEKDLERMSVQTRLNEEKLQMEYHFQNKVKELENLINAQASQYQQEIESLRATFEENVVKERKTHQDALNSEKSTYDNHLQEKIMEISKLKRHIAQLEQSDIVEELRDRIESMKDQIEQYKQKYAHAIQDQEVLANEMQDLQNQVQKLNVELQAKTRYSDMILNESKESQEKYLASQKRIIALLDEIESLKQTNADLLSSYDEFKQEKNQEYVAKLSKLNMKYEGETDSLKEQIKQLEDEVIKQKNNTEALNHQLERSVSQLRKEIQLKEMELKKQHELEENLMAEVKNLKIQISRQTELLKEKDQEIQWIQVQRQLATEEKTVAESECRHLKNDNNRLREANLKLTRELEATSEHINDSAASLKKRYETKLEKVKKELQESKENARNMESTISQLSNSVHCASLSMSEESILSDLNTTSTVEQTSIAHSPVESKLQTPRTSISSNPENIISLESMPSENKSPTVVKVKSIHSAMKKIEEHANHDRHSKMELDKRLAQLKFSLTSYKQKFSSSSYLKTSQDFTPKSQHVPNNSKMGNLASRKNSKYWQLMFEELKKLFQAVCTLNEHFIKPLRSDREIITLLMWTRLFNHFEALSGAMKFLIERFESKNTEVDDIVSELSDRIPIFENFIKHFILHGQATMDEMKNNPSFQAFVQKHSDVVFEDLMHSPMTFLKEIKSLESHQTLEETLLLSTFSDKLNQLLYIIEEKIPSDH